MTMGWTQRPVRASYGDDSSQWGQLYLPDDAPRGTVVVIHGGLWSAQYGLSLGTPLAADLAKRGWAAWNIEYRRLGNGGGWPTTFDDVAAAIDHLAVLKETHAALDLTSVVALGHSAGGHLAAWAAGRDAARVPLTGVVAQAGVLDLTRAARESTGFAVVDQLMGGSPDEVPDLYVRADPSARLPTGVPLHAVHGRHDTAVPFDRSVSYVEAAKAAGDDATLVPVDGDHISLIDVRTSAWMQCVESVAALTT